jgi:hypothetical protein
MTPSARASSKSGTLIPSNFAVLRSMTSSYLVGACGALGARSIIHRQAVAGIKSEREAMADSNPARALDVIRCASYDAAGTRRFGF